jgi:Ca-activated chloride channel homolog
MTSRRQCYLLLLLSISTLVVPVGRSADGPRVSLDPRAKPAVTGLHGPRSEIRVDTTVVLINVTVTGPRSRVVDGLEKENFRLFEDRAEQKVVHFANEDAPVSVGLVFDTSGSMGSKLAKSRQAVSQFFKTANPEDEFFLVQFNDRPALVNDFTTNLEEIQDRLILTQAKGRTALLDAVYMAMHQMKKARYSRKALLLISDGGDNSSRYTESEIKRMVREMDVQIYAIGIFEPSVYLNHTEEASGPGLLSELADRSGGRHFAVENLNHLPDVAAKIGRELRNQYVLGYTPTNTQRDGKYRKVRVELVRPKGVKTLKAIWRPGYYALNQ